MGAAVPSKASGLGMAQDRPTSAMSSRKLLALDFIKRYFATWGRSPTLGEVAAVLGVSTKRAHDLVHQLANEKMIEHIAGQPRGIRLPDRSEELSEADVLVRLAALGWTIGQGDRMIMPPLGAAFAIGAEGPIPAAPGSPACGPLTEKGLHELFELDHDPGQATGAGTGIDGQCGQDVARENRGGTAKGARRAAGSAGSA